MLQILKHKYRKKKCIRRRKISFLKITALILCILSIVFSFPSDMIADAPMQNPWDDFNRFIPENTPVVKREFRAIWVTTVFNLDWPSSSATRITNDAERISRMKSEFISILDKAQKLNVNAIILQVSPEADAFYKSNIVPWSRYLTGTLGKDPGFDPLAFAIEEVHKRNMELHAWFNPYRVSSGISDSIKNSLSISKSIYKEKPEWIRQAAGRFVVDPGIPEARKWVCERVMEVVKNYDIDGVHFDDYFYYENFTGELDDKATFEKYNNGQFGSLGDWRRNNTYLLIKEVSENIRKTKPWVKFGVSPSAVWANKSPGFPEGSNTSTSYTNYGRCYADTRKWVIEEIIDYIAPQIYFTFAHKAVPYGETANWWANLVKGKNVHLYIGLALYKIDDPTAEYYFKGSEAVPEFSRQLKFNATHPFVHGNILFRTAHIDTKKNVVNAMSGDLWRYKALPPLMPWKKLTVPVTPSEPKMSVNASGNVSISWVDNDKNTTYFAVYRFNKSELSDIASNDAAARLKATIRKISHGKYEYTDDENVNTDNVYYVVTAVNRLHTESQPLKISKEKSAYFIDVGEKYPWAAPSIDYLFEKGIIKGYRPGIFGPSDKTTRADFIVMLARALDLKTDFDENFKDVPPSSYYYEAVGTAKKLGIVLGDGENFYPSLFITRQDMMTIIHRTLQIAGYNLEEGTMQDIQSFKDFAKISSYAAMPVATLVRAGIVKGSDGRIMPLDFSTRAQIAVLIHRILELDIPQNMIILVE